jgi:hypothetical protein
VATSKNVFSIGTALPTPQLSSLVPAFCQTRGIQSVNILNLPAVADGITVSSTLDAGPLQIVTGRVQFSVDTLAPGKHVVTVTYSKNSLSTAAADSFTVIKAVTPKVSLSSSVTTITNLATPVVLTASNTQGGGSSPLYSFAGDLAFTHILQQESSAATLTLAASTLNVGNNWIYARMKTSDTCFTAQAGVDSILLKRDVSTGIADPDNPSNTIYVFPNPFDQQIVVKGLNSAKAYRITLLNANGQAIYLKNVRNITVQYISGLNLPSGLYWISVYDDTKKRDLGTMKLTRQP